MFDPKFTMLLQQLVDGNARIAKALESLVDAIKAPGDVELQVRTDLPATHRKKS